MVASGKKCPSRSTTTPPQPCSANFYRLIKRRMGHSLRGVYCQRNLVLPERKLHYLELKAVFLAQKEFQDLCSNKIVLFATDNTTVVAFVNKEGDIKSGLLCALLCRILTWCSRKQVSLKARHIPGQLNVVADKLFKLGQTIQWSPSRGLHLISTRWHQPQINLFATRVNNKLPQFVSPDP